MAKNRLPVSGLLSYADLQELFSCSRSAVVRMWRKLKVIPPPHHVEGLGARWWEDEIYGYIYRLRAEHRAAGHSPPPPPPAPETPPEAPPGGRRR